LHVTERLGLYFGQHSGRCVDGAIFIWGKIREQSLLWKNMLGR
jgi:hypothetical protein